MSRKKKTCPASYGMSSSCFLFSLAGGSGRPGRGEGREEGRKGGGKVIATSQVTVTGEDSGGATCLTLRSLEGLHTNTAVVPNKVDTGSPIQARVRAAFIHI